MHRLASSFVLGYHGCDQSVAAQLVQGADFKPSDHDYDWLVQQTSGNPPIDTVRAVFIEGKPVLPNSGIHEKTHIQIAVCNPDCIKGVFHVHKRFLL